MLSIAIEIPSFYEDNSRIDRLKFRNFVITIVEIERVHPTQKTYSRYYNFLVLLIRLSFRALDNFNVHLSHIIINK